jgi:hypothetical protein
MEQEEKSFKFPITLLMLDMMGSLLVGLGLAKIIAGVDILPVAMQFDEKGWTLIILGGLMMLPFIMHLFAKLRERAEQKLIK